MKIEEAQVKTLRLTELDGLDPVTVMLEGGIGSGKIIIECYGEAWTTFWGSMGEQTVGEFFCTCNNEYLFSKMGGALLEPLYDADGVEHREYKVGYVKRIFDAVRGALEVHYGIQKEG